MIPKRVFTLPSSLTNPLQARISLLILLLLFIGIHTAEADRQTCTHGSEAAPIGHIPGTEAVQELQNKSDCGKYQYGPEDDERYLVCLAVRILHFFLSFPFAVFFGLLFRSACLFLTAISLHRIVKKPNKESSR